MILLFSSQAALSLGVGEARVEMEVDLGSFKQYSGHLGSLLFLRGPYTRLKIKSGHSLVSQVP